MSPLSLFHRRQVRMRLQLSNFADESWRVRGLSIGRAIHFGGGLTKNLTFLSSTSFHAGDARSGVFPLARSAWSQASSFHSCRAWATYQPMDCSPTRVLARYGSHFGVALRSPW